MSDASTVDIDPVEFYMQVRDEMRNLIIGNDFVIRGMTIALLTDSHILLEGVPGVAKTSLAETFSRVTGLGYNRIQMTPDTLPADLSGTTIYEEASGTFEVQKGPVFTNVVVADEINRATPKTQSALLEAMQERQVTIGDRTLPLPSPFVVVATQNPIEMEGVFELPEAQRDRFQQKYTVGIPDRADEATMLDRFDENPRMDPQVVEQVVDPDELEHVQQIVANVHVAQPIKQYILDLVAATRSHSDLEYGGSPRATLAFLNAGKAHAALDGRNYVIPDDIKTLAKPILRHRIVRSTDAQLSARAPDAILDDLLTTVPIPNLDVEADATETDDADAADRTWNGQPMDGTDFADGRAADGASYTDQSTHADTEEPEDRTGGDTEDTPADEETDSESTSYPDSWDVS